MRIRGWSSDVCSSDLSSMADSGMSEDCMKMMAQQPQPAQKPCKGMTLACIAAMGCVIPMAVRNDAPGLAAREAGPTLAFWPTSTVLRGSDLTPEPEPPTLLGDRKSTRLNSSH